jgi:hypothetical protein
MQDDWSDWLAPAEFSYNNLVHSSTNYSPFYLNHGRHPNNPLTNATPSKATTTNPAADSFVNALEDAHHAAAQALTQTAVDMKRFADHHQKKHPAEKYKDGQMVYLKTKNFKTERPSPKLNNITEGPFPIKQKVNDLSYKLVFPLSWKLHPTFHTSLIRPAYINNELHLPRIHNRPPPDVVEDTPEYEVEWIMSHKGVKRR